MTTLTIYLLFDGNCEEAFNYYRSLCGGDYQSISRFSEMPPQEGMPQFPENLLDKIMHVSLAINESCVLMGSDNGDPSKPLQIGNNFSVSIGVDSRKEADRLFQGLSKDGSVGMPLGETFWGSYFGMCTDQFGINWMVSQDIQHKA